jgi:capsular polysaccharide biosynthesis protein
MVADAMRRRACGRVIAMMAKSDDVAQEVTADLVRAVSTAREAPLVIPKPTVRIELCVALVGVGVGIGLMLAQAMHVAEHDEDEHAEEAEEDPSESDAPPAAATPPTT